MGAGTAGFSYNHTMLRVRDPQVSLRFYEAVLGLRLLLRMDFPEGKFSVYYLGYLAPGESLPQDLDERARFVFSRQGVLELTHNWGAESDPAFAGYHNGNDQPQGYGHIAISVPDVEAACEHFEKAGATFKKRPQDGRMKGLAFLVDPDGYWIEIISPTGMIPFVQRSGAV